ncbi:MAG: virulence RhuM family protein [Pseudomonadota bacterium]
MTTGEDRGEALLYRAEDGRTVLDVRLAGETVWLTLNQMAELFGRDKSVISRHLRNVFESRELSRKAIVAKNVTVQIEGGREVTRNVEYYSLDAIISIGYRVNSRRGTQFRVWATRTLKDHLIRSYTFNEQRLREKGLREAEQAVQLFFGPGLCLLQNLCTDRFPRHWSDLQGRGPIPFH